MSEYRELLKSITPWPWVYNPSRGTHDYCIHSASAGLFGTIDPKDGVVGSSEWIWIDEADAEFIAHSPQIISELLDENERLKWFLESMCGVNK